MGGWDEEVWYSLFQIGVLLEQSQSDETPAAYLRAYQARPTRAEPLVALARWHRLRNEFALALIYAREAARMQRPNDQLFVDASVYAWRALDELVISAWWAGARAEGSEAARRLLAASFPASERERIETNAAHYGVTA
jgi:hypothetical protein